MRKLYAILVFAGALVYSSPLAQLFLSSFHNEQYSHFLLIPIISSYFIFISRKQIANNVQPQPLIGFPLLLMSLGIYGLASHFQSTLNLNDFFFLAMLAVCLWIHGGFLVLFGFKAYKNALFPLLFLAFIIPLPTIILDCVIRQLQYWSANTLYLIYQILGIPVLRDGMIFYLPGIAIEVARECSGIRSTLALFITSILIGQLFLTKGWTRILLYIFIIPITILKNAIRITTLSLLSVYVDPSWLTNSWLHSSGGIIFFMIALVLIAPCIWVLHRIEITQSRSSAL